MPDHVTFTKPEEEDAQAAQLRLLIYWEPSSGVTLQADARSG